MTEGGDRNFGLEDLQRKYIEQGEFPTLEEIATADRSQLVRCGAFCGLNIRSNTSLRKYRDRVAVAMVQMYRVVNKLPEEY